MDVFAHALWAAWPFRVANIKKRQKGKKEFRLWPAALWGLFPDLFAFTMPFVWLIYNLIFGNFSLSNLPMPESVEPIANHLLVFQLANVMYSVSHSLIIFALVFISICLIFRKPVWVMMGWLIHILIDIPSHSYQFYPTPIFWPVSEWKFNGISWANGWFMTINYSLLLIAYAAAVYYERKSLGKRLSLKKLKRKLKRKKKGKH
jgi:hypothetical protein